MQQYQNALTLAHHVIRQSVRPGDFCIDATAGRGNDTAFLCSLTGPTGRVIALDIQPEAVACTRALMEEKGFATFTQVVQDCHSHIDCYAAPGSVDCIVFNFGWLPGGNHHIFTRAGTSVAAVERGLPLLRPGGLMSLCIYYGRENGVEERDALLAFCNNLNHQRYTVLLGRFCNRPNNPAFPVFIFREQN